MLTLTDCALQLGSTAPHPCLQVCPDCLTWCVCATSAWDWPSTLPFETQWWRPSWSRPRALPMGEIDAGQGSSPSKWANCLHAEA